MHWRRRFRKKDLRRGWIIGTKWYSAPLISWLPGEESLPPRGCRFWEICSPLWVMFEHSCNTCNRCNTSRGHKQKKWTWSQWWTICILFWFFTISWLYCHLHIFTCRRLLDTTSLMRIRRRALLLKLCSSSKATHKRKGHYLIKRIEMVFLHDQSWYCRKFQIPLKRSPNRVCIGSVTSVTSVTPLKKKREDWNPGSIETERFTIPQSLKIHRSGAN